MANIGLDLFIPEGPGNNRRRVNDKLRDVVSVKDFGAKGDGISDDTIPIQAAIDTGKGVYFPDASSHYVITSTLTVSTAGQKLTFQSRNAKIRPSDDTFDALDLAASFVEVHNGYLQGRASGTTSTTAGIRISNCTRGVIYFVRVEGFGYGIRGQGATANWINNIVGCYIYNNKRCGIYGCGNATSIFGGEIAGSVFGICQAALQDSTALAVDRDTTGVLGQNVLVSGMTIEGIAESKTISGAADNGSGLVRITTSAAHGWQTGDYISIDSVGGTTEANGVWPITVISSTTFDLKTSAFANAYTSGGTARRGYGIYTGNGQAGTRVSGCYFEEVPVVYKGGDSFRNDGTTAHTTLVLGGLIEGCYVGNTYQGTLLAVDRIDNVKVDANYGSGTVTSLINNRGANYTAVVGHESNQGFARTFETTGTQNATNALFKPSSKSGGKVLIAQVPTSSSDPTLTAALEIENYGDSTHVATFSQPVRFADGLRDQTSGARLLWGSGTPEGAVTAPIGSLFLRTDGGAGTTLYIKESGTGNTGWAAK